MAFTVSQTVIVLVILNSVHYGNGFNLSPVPNYMFKQPPLQTAMKQNGSSYFGYSVNLRKTGVIVGAPRADTESEAQRRKGKPDSWMNDTGAVYQCNFNGNPPCRPFNFDRHAQLNTLKNYMEEITTERKAYAMLGATVDGHGHARDWFVACAPNLLGIRNMTYHMNGVCYLTDDTDASDSLKYVHKIKPLRIKDNQSIGLRPNAIHNYQYGEQGFSVHLPDAEEEIVIGAPGVMNWAGTVIRYRQLSFLDKPSTGRNIATKNTYHEPSDRRQPRTHESVVPNPLHSSVKMYSYLGYAVSSGRFEGARKSLLYVASAPHAQDHLGEVIIFNYTLNRELNETVISKRWSFVGQQFGEYFGYSLLTDDFNGDGRPDLAVGAPMHSRTMEYDNGVVYVFLNDRKMSFGLQLKLASSYELSGRFGTSLGKIGDVNKDGYNDIAVGAPFEGSGVVYIFLGSTNGLQPKPSQRLEPPAANTMTRPTKQLMFGHAISRGIDIDGNGYNDLAIGAPNAETVYVYRTYPIVRVQAKITFPKDELPAERSSLEVTVCWSTDFPAGTPFEVALEYGLKFDVNMRRATVNKGITSGEIVIEANVLVCRNYSVTVNSSPTTLHSPLLIELHYGIAQKHHPAEDGRFCDHCYLLHSTNAGLVQAKIPFKTGCSKETCVSDLKIVAIRWMDIVSPYVLGSTNVATMEVKIENAGENAYLPQLNVSVGSSLPLAKLPAECEESSPDDDLMSVLCDLNDRLPLRSKSSVKYYLVFDTTQLDLGRNLTFHTRAITDSEERDPFDNESTDELALIEFNDVDIQSFSNPENFNLDIERGAVTVTHVVKLYNNGPSPLRDFMLHVDVPLGYTHTRKRCQAIALRDVTVRSIYNDTALEIDWVLSHDSSFFKQSTIMLSEDESQAINETVYEDRKQVSNRRKRSSETKYSRPQSSSSISHSERFSHRTRFFNCTQNNPNIGCLQLQTRLHAVAAGKEPVRIEVQFKLDLSAIQTCLGETEDIFLLDILSHVRKHNDERKQTYSVSTNARPIEAYRIVSQPTPIWIYGLSSVGGMLLLVAVTYAMHRGGFFERSMKTKLMELHRASMIYEEASDFSTHD